MVDKDLVIKERLEKKTYASIARKYGVSRQRIHQIVTGYKSFSAQGFTKDDILKFREMENCEECGNKAQCVHHIDGNFKNNKDENLLLLCNRCHGTKHGWFDGGDKRKRRKYLRNYDNPYAVENFFTDKWIDEHPNIKSILDLI